VLLHPHASQFRHAGKLLTAVERLLAVSSCTMQSLPRLTGGRGGGGSGAPDAGQLPLRADTPLITGDALFVGLGEGRRATWVVDGPRAAGDAVTPPASGVGDFDEHGGFTGGSGLGGRDAGPHAPLGGVHDGGEHAMELELDEGEGDDGVEVGKGALGTARVQGSGFSAASAPLAAGGSGPATQEGAGGGEGARPAEVGGEGGDGGDGGTDAAAAADLVPSAIGPRLGDLVAPGTASDRGPTLEELAADDAGGEAHVLGHAPGEGSRGPSLGRMVLSSASPPYYAHAAPDAPASTALLSAAHLGLPSSSSLVEAVVAAGAPSPPPASSTTFDSSPKLMSRAAMTSPPSGAGAPRPHAAVQQPLQQAAPPAGAAFDAAASFLVSGQQAGGGGGGGGGASEASPPAQTPAGHADGYTEPGGVTSQRLWQLLGVTTAERGPVPAPTMMGPGVGGDGEEAGRGGGGGEGEPPAAKRPRVGDGGGAQ
jgi:hypothetical protein